MKDFLWSNSNHSNRGKFGLQSEKYPKVFDALTESFPSIYNKNIASSGKIIVNFHNGLYYYLD